MRILQKKLGPTDMSEPTSYGGPKIAKIWSRDHAKIYMVFDF